MAGGVAGSAAELITQERAALSNIHAMLESLESQQRSLLSSLHAKQVCCPPSISFTLITIETFYHPTTLNKP